MSSALAMYEHYRSGTGTEKTVDLKAAYENDAMIKAFIDKEIQNLKTAVQDIYFETLSCKFSVTSNLVGASESGYYPKTANWQKTLGDVLIWISADIKYDGKKDEFSATIVVHSLDFYDFNSEGVDLATGTPDAVNGRFSTLAWAKGFETKGKLTMKISWRI